MGDYNINTMNEMQVSATVNQEFYNIFLSHYYHKLNYPPETLLDNIYTNIPDCYNTCTSGVLRFLHNQIIILCSLSGNMTNLPNQTCILVKEVITIKI